MKVLFVVNEARFFVSHRLPIGQQAQAAGFEVVVVSAPNTGEEVLAGYGMRHRAVPLTRSGVELLSETKAYRELARIYREERPSLVHHVTIKPVLYGAGDAHKVVLDPTA